MRYTWPKFRLCRREWVNLFWLPKYDIKKRRTLPWQHWKTMWRLSEYWKMLRNKQMLKRIYMLSEKQFKNTVMWRAAKYAKNKGLDHDKSVILMLESRLDVIVLKAWFANSISQARQLVTHWHFLLNGIKHNIPSYFIVPWDELVLRERLKKSPFYENIPVLKNKNLDIPTWISVEQSNYKIKVLSLPNVEEITVPADVLKVVEFYAR